MDAYIASLPHGLSSYSGCQQKAIILSQFIGPTPASEIAPALPPELASLVLDPPLATEWIAEVKTTAIYLALRDAMGSDDAFVAHAYAMNRRLLARPVYRILFALTSPETVLRGATARWGQMHRGTELRPHKVVEGEAVFRLTFPPGLVPAILARAYTTAYRAAIEMAGAIDATVTFADQTSTGCTFTAHWRRS